VFTSNRESEAFQHDLYIMNADGSNVRRISTLATNQTYLDFVLPSWSPDHQHIVATLVDGNNALGIYIIDVDTAAIHRVQYDVYLRGLTSYPRWKPS
jgi:Tol biopolymer transport system component